MPYLGNTMDMTNFVAVTCDVNITNNMNHNVHLKTCECGYCQPQIYFLTHLSPIICFTNAIVNATTI